MLWLIKNLYEGHSKIYEMCPFDLVLQWYKLYFAIQFTCMSQQNKSSDWFLFDFSIP